MTETVSIQSFAASSASLPALMDFVALRSSDLGVPRGTSLRLQLVAEELFTNTFRHGISRMEQDQPQPTVSIRIELAGEDIELTYEDAELAWNPLDRRNPAYLQLPLAQRPVGGLGVVLVDSFAERIQYERIEQRNRVRVWMRCDPRERP
ncbi:MAG TPA: ATP-binding protein [Nevskia sp.]|nr:ATP-binding protein [Nevskia sp.]